MASILACIQLPELTVETKEPSIFALPPKTQYIMISCVVITVLISLLVNIEARGGGKGDFSISLYFPSKPHFVPPTDPPNPSRTVHTGRG